MMSTCSGVFFAPPPPANAVVPPPNAHLGITPPNATIIAPLNATVIIPPNANVGIVPPNVAAIVPPTIANINITPTNVNASTTLQNANVVASPPNLSILIAIAPTVHPTANALIHLLYPTLPVPVVYTYNDVTDLNYKPWDLSTHANQACWIAGALSADPDHKQIDISVNTALLLMDHFEGKAFFFGWEQLISVPTNGDGLYGPTSAPLSNGEPVMSVNITTRANVLCQWKSVSLLAWI
jgi:hypothetical protein